MGAVRAFCVFVAAMLVAAASGHAASPYTPLYSFTGQPDGAAPFGKLSAANGATRYGTTYQGGTGPCTGFLAGCGTVYSLKLSYNGTEWTAAESVIYSFQGGSDGSGPEGGILVAPGGVLYGTTSQGGAHQNGTLFSLVKRPDGWKKTVLFDFNGSGGGSPTSYLLLGSDGALYGTAGGGQYGQGVVFQVQPPMKAGGAWTENVLYSFPGGTGGQNPTSGLVGDPATGLFGTVSYGGSGPCSTYNGQNNPPLPGCGAVFKLTQTSPGVWAPSLIYSFHGSPNDGQNPGALSMGTDGALYGSTFDGGLYHGARVAPFGCGLVYSIAPTGPAGSWVETVLYRFATPSDGNANPSSVIYVAPGMLLGTTNPRDGDAYSTVFALSSASGVWRLKQLIGFQLGHGETNPMITVFGRYLLGLTAYGGGGGGSVFLLAQ